MWLLSFGTIEGLCPVSYTWSWPHRLELWFWLLLLCFVIGFLFLVLSDQEHQTATKNSGVWNTFLLQVTVAWFDLGRKRADLRKTWTDFGSSSPPFPLGLFWNNTMHCPGSRATLPHRIAAPAFLSTLWCSHSYTMPSWTSFNIKTPVRSSPSTWGARGRGLSGVGPLLQNRPPRAQTRMWGGLPSEARQHFCPESQTADVFATSQQCYFWWLNITEPRRRSPPPPPTLLCGGETEGSVHLPKQTGTVSSCGWLSAAADLAKPQDGTWLPRRPKSSRL